MSRTARHAHARRRWVVNQRARVWEIREPRRALQELALVILDGDREFADTDAEGRLDYVTHDYLHVWDARGDRRKMRRRARDRYWTGRPQCRSSRDKWANFFHAMESDASTCPGCHGVSSGHRTGCKAGET